MATFTWQGGSGDLSDPSQWVGHIVPNLSNPAAIVVSGDVTLNGSGDVGPLSLQDPSGTLSIAGTLDALALTAIGTITVQAGGTLATIVQAAVGNFLGSGFISASGTGALLSIGTGVQFGNVANQFFAGTSGTLAASSFGDIDVAGPVTSVLGSIISVDATGTVEIGGSGHGTAGAITLDRLGAVVGTGTLSGPITGRGGVSTGTNGDLELAGPVTGSIRADIASGGTLLIDGAFAAPAFVNFANPQPNADTLILQMPSAFSGTIDTSIFGGTLALVGIDATGASVVVNPNTAADDDLLVVTQSIGPALSLELAGASQAGEQVGLIVTGGGGGGGASVTDVTLPCFAAGTRLLTARGEVPVEFLGVGDEVVVTGDRGALRPVCWIGQVSVDVHRHPEPHRVAPVRIRQSAFAPGKPHRDLLLSPDHAVWLQDSTGPMLIPIHLLVNGATIAQELSCRRITYCHVELPEHAVLLAEGLAAESYLDTGNRQAFANGGRVRSLRPDFGPGSAQAVPCAPLLLSGALVDDMHARLLARAASFGWRLSRDPDVQVTAGGRKLRPLLSGPVRWQFTLPPGTETIDLLSRSAVPNQVSPGADDRRSLGVALARLRHGAADVPLENRAFFAGCYELERSGRQAWRWTNGRATIRLQPQRDVSLLEIQINSGWLHYWVEEELAPAVDQVSVMPSCRDSLQLTEGFVGWAG